MKPVDRWSASIRTVRYARPFSAIPRDGVAPALARAAVPEPMSVQGCSRSSRPNTRTGTIRSLPVGTISMVSSTLADGHANSTAWASASGGSDAVIDTLAALWKREYDEADARHYLTHQIGDWDEIEELREKIAELEVEVEVAEDAARDAEQDTERFRKEVVRLQKLVPVSA